MTWLGAPSSAVEEYKKTFKIVAAIAIINYVIISTFDCATELPEEVDGEITMVKNEDCPAVQANFAKNITFIFGIYVLIVMYRLRKAIRTKYSIPEENCIGFEDFCCVFWCGCCSVIQMAHQTADYDDEEAYCLTETGLAKPETGTAAAGTAIVV